MLGQPPNVWLSRSSLAKGLYGFISRGIFDQSLKLGVHHCALSYTKQRTVIPPKLDRATVILKDLLKEVIQKQR